MGHRSLVLYEDGKGRKPMKKTELGKKRKKARMEGPVHGCVEVCWLTTKQKRSVY